MSLSLVSFLLSSYESNKKRNSTIDDFMCISKGTVFLTLFVTGDSQISSKVVFFVKKIEKQKIVKGIYIIIAESSIVVQREKISFLSLRNDKKETIKLFNLI